jgi:hypothetical protein
MKLFARAWSFTFASVVAASLATAGQTWIVDDNGGAGVDFTQIDTAIATVAAGDVLLVRPGSYAAFTLDKELTLVGQSGASVSGLGRITNLAAGSRATVVRLTFLHGLEVLACTGGVVCDDIGVYGPGITVTGCADVRFHATTVNSGASQNGVRVDGSRVEFVSSTIWGGDGIDSPNSDFGSDGGYGLWCQSQSRVHLALTSVFGGDGGDACSGFCGGGYGGDGRPAISAFSSAVIIAGNGADSLIGGRRGGGNFPGSNGPGITLSAGATLRWSGVSISGGGSSSSGYAQPIVPAVAAVSPPDPTVEITGTPTPGGSLNLRLYATPGTFGRLQQGNQMLVVDDGLSAIEKLNNRIRIHPLGPVPAGGVIDYPLVVPSNWLPGQFRVFQGLEIDGATAMLIERTNSVPVVVR